MGRSNLFYFRHFVINQQHCAMKVGADSMLLGALTFAGNASYILDIGTGTGVLALMMAQKSIAQIHAVEIVESAYMQASENALASSWKHRINVFHTDIQKFIPTGNIKYDLIISNPPYFAAGKSGKNKSPVNNRAFAREQSLLTFEGLIKQVVRLINNAGRFAVIIPFSEKDDFIRIAANYQLFALEITNIRSRQESEFIRCVLVFSQTKGFKLQEKYFTIYSELNLYTEEYLEATAQFHAHDMRNRRK